MKKYRDYYLIAYEMEIHMKYKTKQLEREALNFAIYSTINPNNAFSLI